MIQKTLVALLLTVSAALAIDPCQGTDVYFQNECYDYVRLQGTFDDARKFCYKYGRHPTRIVNMIQNRAVTDYAGDNLDDTYALFWVGASDRTGVWLWDDGTPLNFTNWDNGQPMADRHCLAIKVSTGKWTTELCSNPHQFVCEIDAYVYPSQDPNTPTCPPCAECSYFRSLKK